LDDLYTVFALSVQPLTTYGKEQPVLMCGLLKAAASMGAHYS